MATSQSDPKKAPLEYWNMGIDKILELLTTSESGLSSNEAKRRLATFGFNEFRDRHKYTVLRVFWNQIKSPLVLILVFAAVISGFTENLADAGIVFATLLGSAGIGFWREYSSNSAIEELSSRIQPQANILRDNQAVLVPMREAVPGDVILLAAGTLISADAIVLAAEGLFLDQAVVSGESFPVEKKALKDGLTGLVSFADRNNFLFQGTHVRSGTGRAVIVKTGRDTSYGEIIKRLNRQAPQTEFDLGLKEFSNLLLKVMLVMVIVAFAASHLMGRPPSESLMFAVALAIGLSPELLPAIVTVNLARSATILASKGVLVRHLNAIENLGSMDTLCTDKTGTLTEGLVELQGSFDCEGKPSQDVFALALANASLQSGLPNPLDQAILRRSVEDRPAFERITEIPYDFIRKRMSVVVRDGDAARIICKGALDQLLEVSTSWGDSQHPLDEIRTSVQALFQGWSDQGIRVLGVATGKTTMKESYDKSDETKLALQGFITFSDQPKADVSIVIQQLRELGVAIKVITGDNHLVAQHVAQQVGIDITHALTGEELDELSSDALLVLVDRVSVFSQMNPNQKERIILALRKRKHVVGYMGDGINDTPAMHAADASISVESAVEVAKATADFVLLEKDLGIILRGIKEGRKTFGNTQKYILMTTSANLGNMISMTVAALVLPFLPLLAGQILLNNFLSDIPAVGLADDSIDPEMIATPKRWDMSFVKSFMIQFGVVSSLFDFAAFALLILAFKATPEIFRTAWFLESLLTELAITFVLRTRRRFNQSRPGRLLLGSSITIAILALLIPFLPLTKTLGFTPLSAPIMATVIALTSVYVLSTEWIKKGFYRRWNKREAGMALMGDSARIGKSQN